MKAIKKTIAILCILATLLSSFCLTAAAASAVSSVDCQNRSNRNGGTSVYFYVKASGTTCKINFKCGKGSLDWAGGDVMPTAYVNGAYEVKVYKWNQKTKKTTGSCLFDKDIYNAANYTASFRAEKNCYYRVQVYFWNAKTTANSYWNKKIIRGTTTFTTVDRVYVAYYGTPHWTSFPSITAKNGGNCTLYKSMP